MHGGAPVDVIRPSGRAAKQASYYRGLRGPGVARMAVKSPNTELVDAHKS